ncbi:hypothetical protein Ana3638_12520 [Anaerocolumna sedimenticola]|uniref:Transposase n=1 Tax=Anaerocolumna sedimenticola TaxID=2696063 RepID=A0A6P1TUS5_9FIRM|nr:hypothetical protein Ana3638_12520 [Anaerocolumna sedimenticola]
MDPFSKCLFLFCGRYRDRIKALLWKGDDFILRYKGLENGNFQCHVMKQKPAPFALHQAQAGYLWLQVYPILYYISQLH